MVATPMILSAHEHKGAAMPQAERETLRETLIAAYEGQCAISGCAVTEALDVVLLNPHGPCESGNALLLRADLCRLFSAGLLSIDAISLKVFLASEIAAATDYANLTNAILRQPARISMRCSRQMLDAHHRRFVLRQLSARRAANTTQVPPETARPVLKHTIAVKSWVNSVAYNRDGAQLATGSWDGVARIWRAEDGYLLHTLQADLGEVNSVSFSPNGSVLATAGRNQVVQLWRVSDGASLYALQGPEGHSGAVFSVSFSPDSSML
ncbi:MAG: WD40 repeat domain-containing protein, partial [Oscillochloris sp.]|nr:WD40 repeat domain-containing protein [Oscillochloris sp.]